MWRIGVCVCVKIIHHRLFYAAILGCHSVLWQLYQEFKEQTRTCRPGVKSDYLPIDLCPVNYLPSFYHINYHINTVSFSSAWEGDRDF